MANEIMTNEIPWDPHISPDYLIELSKNSNLYPLINVEEYIINRNFKPKVLVNASLFNKNADDFQGGSASLDQDLWRRKYFTGLLNRLNEWEEKCSGHGLDLYLEPSLYKEVESYIKNKNFLNVFIMEKESNAATGAFWRFLGFNKDYGQEISCMIDIDVPQIDYHKNILKYRKPSRLSDGFCSRSEMFANQEKTSKKYSSIVASHISFYVSDIDYNIKDLIVGYWEHVINNIHLEPKTDYNKSYNLRPHGFGNIWNLYGSDERFLSKTLYHYLTKKGKLNLLVPMDVLKLNSYELFEDIKFTRKFNNQIIYYKEKDLF